MKILLTGSSGMVGMNILENENVQKYSILKPSSTELNLLDYDEVSRYLIKHKPDIVIHVAGLVGGIQANIANPVDFLVKNLDMGRNIVLASRENGIERLINVASSCIYPRNGTNPLKEEAILTGELEPTNEGYALAKIVITRLCEYISQTDSNFSYKTIIPCNLYGRHDKFSPKHSHMLPAVIKKIYEAKIYNKKEVSIWGDGKSRREFMYAGDFADFIFYALRNFSKTPQNMNVGIGTDYSINEYYEAVAKVVGYNNVFVHDLSKPAGMKKKLVSNEKLKEFGWAPKTSLEEGIYKTYQFFKSINND